MNKVLLIALVLLAGCYTPPAYEIWLDLNDLEVLSKQGEIEKRMSSIDTRIDHPPLGPAIKIRLTKPVRIFFIPDEGGTDEPEDVPFDPYQPPEWDETQPEWDEGK